MITDTEQIEFRREWLNIFEDMYYRSKRVSNGTFEIEDYSFTLDTRNKLANFLHRKLSTKYLIAELIWYHTGNRDSNYMEKFSSLWQNVKNEVSPYYNSNYGHYFYTEGQFKYVIDILLKDKNSRQGCIVLNRPEVMMSNSKDKICTNSISFRIRDNCLNMSVSMRSNDLIYGTCVDVFQFLILYEYALATLRSTYPDLKRGRYYHKADSMHFYDKHVGMLRNIIRDPYFSYIEVPEIDPKDLDTVFFTMSRITNESNIDSSINFLKFINQVK